MGCFGTPNEQTQGCLKLGLSCLFLNCDAPLSPNSSKSVTTTLLVPQGETMRESFSVPRGVDGQTKSAFREQMSEAQ